GLVTANANSYTFTLTNVSGCTSLDSSSIVVNAQPVTPAASTISSTTATCSSIGTSTISNYSSSNTYVFDPATAGITINTTTGLISGLTIGTSYTVTAGNGSCTSVGSLSFSNAAQLATPSATLVLSGTSSICISATTNISVANSEVGISYQLRNGVTNVGTAVIGTGGTISLSTGALNSTTTFNVLATNTSTTCSTQLTETEILTVNNCTPVASNSTINVAEESTNTGLGLTVPTDPDTTILTIAITGLPTLGTVTLADGTSVTNGQTLTSTQLTELQYDAPADYNGIDTVGDFAYIVSDGTTVVNGQTRIAVTIVNDPPVADNDPATTAYDTNVDILASTGDTDIDGSINLASIDLDPTTPANETTFTVTGEGTYTANANGTVTFNPLATFSGITTLVNYTIEDATGTNSNVATLQITVANNPPVADNDPATTVYDTNVDILASTGDTDIDGSINLASIDLDPTTPANETTFTVTGEGTYTANANGTVTFNPLATFSGITTLVNYTIEDATGTNSNVATLQVTVANNPPVADNDPATTAYDTNVDVLASTGDTDIDGNINLASIDLDPTTPANETTFTVTGEGTYTANANGTVTFNPLATFSGTTTLVNYTIEDATGTNSNVATLQITVANNPPVADNNTNSSISSTAGATVISPLAATDIDGMVLSYTVLSLPANGILALSGTAVFINQVLTAAQVALLTYDPSGTFVGNDIFTFTATDNNGALDVTPATIIIPVGNNVPIANNNTNAGILSTATAILIAPLTATDTDGTIASYTILSLPANGILALSGVSVNINQVLTSAQVALLTYDPSGSFSGNDSFTFTATDNNGSLDLTPATITVVVNPSIDATNDVMLAAVPGGVATITLSLFGNDSVNGNSFTPSQITLTTLLIGGGIVMNADGTLSIPANAPSGSYPVIYTICTVATPVVCDTATTMIVVNPSVDATNDVMLAAVPGGVATITPSLFGNDSVNGNPFTPSQITLTTLPIGGGIVMNADGTLTIPANAPSGNYAVTYTICTKATPVVCDTATTMIIVNPSVDATNDMMPAAVPGGVVTTTPSLFGNDSVNGNPFTPSQITLTTLPIGGGIVMNADGTLTIPANAPSGNYAVTYTICTKATPVVCDTATTMIIVNPSVDATNDMMPAAVPGGVVTTTPSLFSNDSVNGNPFTPSQITLTILPIGGGIVMNTDGTLTIPANAPSGSYLVIYTICTKATPVVCDTAITTIIVNPSIDATNDVTTTVPAGVVTVLPTLYANDNVNGNPFIPSQITLTVLQPIGGGIVMNEDGTLSIPANAPSGSYAISYRICTNATPVVCDTATKTIIVAENPSIALVKTATFNDENGDGYAQADETISYSFVITNTGNVALSNVSVKDNYLPDVILTGSPIVSLGIGKTNSTAYTAIYSIKQNDINVGSIVNQASVTATSLNGTVITDLSDDSSDLDDKPTVLGILGCVLEVFNAVSPNGDGDNDVFYIRGLECYPKNTVEIYNRWGVLVFEINAYNNSDRAFKGISEGRVTVNQAEELPAGTYYYILRYTDSASIGHEKAGYLYINR
ncbi:Ig-like domain-containing protein, partial [Flavobacterium sp. LB1P71]|uniref:Ig-like domain-containing protein n=1 Tax=unclassified Flavobacterium TaxID=196869 RepID=UPI003AB0A23E